MSTPTPDCPSWEGPGWDGEGDFPGRVDSPGASRPRRTAGDGHGASGPGAGLDVPPPPPVSHECVPTPVGERVGVPDPVVVCLWRTWSPGATVWS